MILTSFIYSFISLVLSASCFAAPCIDITGDYSSGTVSPDKGTLIWSFKQNGCESISMGSYYLWGTTTNDISPQVINYVHKGMQELCGTHQCFEFQEIADGLEYLWNGSIKIDGVYSCRYSRVDIFLHSGDLLRKFFISDLSPNCKGKDTYTITLNRVR
jgi:hypothetical protein